MAHKTEYEQSVMKLGAGSDPGSVRRYSHDLLSLDIATYVKTKIVDYRDEHIQRFGFAIPNMAAIKRIASLGKILEVGAGSGYWAYELKKAGADVIATDTGAWNEQAVERRRWTKEWFEVERLDAVEAVKKYPDRVLLMVWPSYKADWSGLAVKAYQGDVLVHVGENSYGCTGGKLMWDELHEHWDLANEDVVDIPRWDSISDDVQIWRRK